MLDQNGVPISSQNATSTRVAAISVVDHCLPYDTHNLYDVTFHTHIIHTLLTSDPSLVHSWISTNVRSNRTQLMVGLDIEWRPNTQRNMQNPVATLQLCLGQHCLKLGDRELNQAGIKSLGLRVLGLEVEKPKRVTRSRWDNPWLTPVQVQYATVDAFLSYEIGRSLSSPA
ncbi:hypothetical protein ACSQ67_016402 [Phaseolus vulgaris]